MDMPEVKAFNAELSGLYENKPPISKAKMSAITKGAIKAIKFYKHVVHSVEKFIQKCKAEYKVPGLYVIDSIVRQSRHQFGQDKDVFAPRFAKNMQQTFANLFRCPPEDKRNIIRVLNLWQKNNVFGPDVIQPLLDMADPNHPLHQEILQQQNSATNGNNLIVAHNTTDSKLSPMALQHTPRASTPPGDQFQDQLSGPPPGLKFNRKLLNDFEYESEDEAASAEPPAAHVSHAPHSNHNPADALGSILTNPEIMRQLQSLQAQMQMMTGLQIPNLMPMMSDLQLQPAGQAPPLLSGQQEPQKQNDPKEDVANESDIEFVETGPQVIEIPDANDSRSPTPRSRRHRSRSKSPKRRRRSRSRTRSRSPRRRRDRDRDRDREKSHKEREAEKEKQREREKKGLPPIKKENLSVCSTTLWVGHLSKLATPEELSDLFGGVGGVQAIDVVAPRGCAFVVMERRRDAAKALAKLNRHKLHSKEITVAWAAGKGVKGREWKDYWEAELGVAYLPWEALHQRWVLGALSLDALEDGGAVDEDTLPPWLPPRIIPKSMMDGMPLLGALPPPVRAALPALPAALPVVPRMPPPGMTAGIPPGFAPALPPGIPAGVPGLQREGPLLGFPAGLPPQSLPQPGMVSGFLGGLVGGLVLPLHPQQHQQPPPAHHAAVGEAAAAGGDTAPDDAMELDPEEPLPEPAPALLPDQIQAMMSQPPPNFKSSEPPPMRFPGEAAAFDSSQPPPGDDKRDEERRERDKDRRDRDRDRADRRERDRERTDRRDRDRDRRDRERAPRDRDRERDERRERERGREGREGRERRERDRAARDRSRERSPRAGGPEGEKSLQERLWEMANGGGDRGDPRDPSHQDRVDAPPALEHDGGPDAERRGAAVRVEGEAGAPGWPPRMPPPYRTGPWMEVQGPSFGPRYNGMGPPVFNRPPFERPPFDGGPIFEGPSRFERPPFNRVPFDINRPPFDGPRPPFDGPRPPFDGPRPPFDGNRVPFDGPRPHFDGHRPPFDGPPRQFEGERPFDGPRFDGPPEYFDRSGRFEEREQFNERGWNGDRDREWDRRNEWDDRRKERRSRERGDRRRTVEEKPRQPRDERTSRRDKDRKSRWGAAEDVVQTEERERVATPRADDARDGPRVTQPEETGSGDDSGAPLEAEDEAPASRAELADVVVAADADNSTEGSDTVKTSGTASDLYDASDAVDTSFAAAEPSEAAPAAPPPGVAPDTPTLDIFNSRADSDNQNEVEKEALHVEVMEGIA